MQETITGVVQIGHDLKNMYDRYRQGHEHVKITPDSVSLEKAKRLA